MYCRLARRIDHDGISGYQAYFPFEEGIVCLAQFEHSEYDTYVYAVLAKNILYRPCPKSKILHVSENIIKYIVTD